MHRDQIVINTLVFQNDLETGKRQHELFSGLQKLGVKNVEVRREYVSDPDEFRLIRKAADEHGFELFYSVPDILFENGAFKRDSFQMYIEEAVSMQARMIKFTIGDFDVWKSEDVASFHEITKNFAGVVTVENDQTRANGKMKALVKFLEACKTQAILIYATFDVGNGYWVGENPLLTVSEIQSFTRFVHLKDVVMADSVPKVALLGEGEVPWQDVLEAFKPDVFAAIEYPCGENPFDRLKEEMAKLMAV
ncbi:MAG TPA: hypothetical protein VFK33_13350 [Bacillales bacterium]|nr:hypothetical protein [Bacillales bacterium]